MGPGELAFARMQIAKLELRLAHIHEPRFVLNSQSLVRDCDLIVLDEVSMVGEEMANDLLAFGKPILVLGDPGQLPPIHGEGAFTNAAPDVMLDEIHRQAEGSAILRLATMARQGLAIDDGAYDAHVWKMSRRDVSPGQMLKGGQVLCGSNATRRGLNMSMKRAAGFAADLPTGSGEKIICLKNRHDLGLINGMFLTLSDVRHEARNETSFSAAVQTEDGQEIAGRQHFWRGEYDDHIVFDRDRGRRDAHLRRTPDRNQLGLRHHRPQVAGQLVGQRHSLRRRLRPHGHRPQPLALHRHHARRERSGDPVMNNDVSNQARKTSEEVRHV